jgi:zinc protease
MRMSFDDSKDALYGSFETLTANRDKAIALLKIAVQKPRFDPDAVDRIRQQLLANIAYADKDPDKVAGREWYALAFAGHPTRVLERHGRNRQQNHARRSPGLHKRTLPRAIGKSWLSAILTPPRSANCSTMLGGLPDKADLLPVAKTDPIGGSRRSSK